MNLKELEDFKLSQAVEFHDQLNPALFRDEHMIPKVRQRLLEIAADFMDHLGVNDIDVEDITLSGSNASYTYTSHSDIDLHILVNMDKLKNNEIYSELFHTKKILWNMQHDITIGGYEVELYVQDTADPVVSRGEYSVLNDRWIKFPKKRMADINEPMSKRKFEKLVQVAELALQTDDLEKIEQLLQTIRKYRQAGLELGGEFSPENIAFKAFRTSGLLHRLRDEYNVIHSKRMSMEQTVKVLDKPTLSITDLSKKHRVSRDHIISQLKKGIKTELEHTSVRSVAKEIALDHLGENPNYYTKLVKANLEEKTQINNKKINFEPVINDILELLPRTKEIWFHGSRAVGKYKPSSDIDVLVIVPDGFVGEKYLDLVLNLKDLSNKYFKFDIQASHLNSNIHRIASEEGKLLYKSDNLTENSFVNLPTKSFKELYHVGSLDPSKKRMGSYEGAGLSVSTHPNAWRKIARGMVVGDTYVVTKPNNVFLNASKLTKALKREIADWGISQQLIKQTIVYRVSYYDDELESEVYSDYASLKDAKEEAGDELEIKKLSGYEPTQKLKTLAHNNYITPTGILDYVLPIYAEANGYDGVWWQDKLDVSKYSAPRGVIVPSKVSSWNFEKFEAVNEGASGYIPSEAEADDPRFKTALTVDIKPNSIQQNAIKLGLGKIKRSGIPPTAKPSGKF